MFAGYPRSTAWLSTTIRRTGSFGPPFLLISLRVMAKSLKANDHPEVRELRTPRRREPSAPRAAELLMPSATIDAI